MKNYEGDWQERTAVAPEGGVVSGTPIMIGNVFGIPNQSAAEGEVFNFVVAGRFRLPKATGVSFADGGNAYWNESTGEVTSDNTKIPIGQTYEAAGSSATDVGVTVLPSAMNDLELTGKADKVSSAVNGNFAALNASGNLTDSGHKDADYADADHTHADKADVVTSPTAGNFAGLDAQGNLTDSGHKDADYADADHTHADKADVVTSPTAGNFAGLDAQGNLTDSGHKDADYADADHTHAAADISVTAIEHETGTDVQAVLADLVARVYALENP